MKKEREYDLLTAPALSRLHKLSLPHGVEACQG
jgi:hypothetical protein